MTRTEFLTKLEQALAALPYEERRDALNYYEEYFDSAGQENEAQTIADLGSPEEVARSILESSAESVSDAAAEPSEAKAATPKKTSSKKKKPYFTSFDYKVLLVGAVALLLCKFGTTSKATLAPSSGSSSSQPQTVVSTSVSSAVSSMEEPTSSTEEPASSTTEVSSTKDSDEPADLTLVLPISDLQDVLELELAYGNVQFKTSPADTENSTFEFEDFLLDYLHQGSPAEHQTCFTYKLPENYDVSHLPEASLTITLPENVLKKLKLKLAMGDVSLGDLSLTDLRVNLAMGDLSAASLTTSSANVNLAMGNLEIDTLDCEEPDIRLAMGETEIGLLIHSEDLTLENAMGDIKLTLAGTPSDYNFTVHTPGILRVDGSSYKLRYESTSDSDRHARITSSIGNVTLSFQN